MSLGKKIGMGLSLLGAKATGKSFPFMVNWAITGRCNLRCRHCYGAYGYVKRPESTLEEMSSVIDSFKKMGTKRFTLEGGEPLLRHDIVQIVDGIASRGMEVSICSNGIFLERYIRDFKDKVDLLVFSLDGREEYNNWLRGKDTYAKTLEALELSAKYGIKTLLFTTLIDKNIADIDFLASLARDYNTNITFNIAVAQFSGSEERSKLNKLKNDKYRDAISKIIELKKDGFPIYYSDANYRQALHWPDYDNERYFSNDLELLSKKDKKHLIPCFAGKRFVYIESNGDLYPCYQTVGTIPVKNIIKDGVEEAFHHLSTLDYCKSCYNLTLSELNLQANLNMGSVAKVVKNYFIAK